MWEFLVDRCLYLCMAAVLIFPEPATFALFLAIAMGGCAAGLQFAWALLRDDDRFPELPSHSAIRDLLVPAADAP